MRTLVLAAAFIFLCMVAVVSFYGSILGRALSMESGSEVHAAYLNCAYWTALMVSRLITVSTAVRIQVRGMLFANVAGCIAAATDIVCWPDPLSALWLGTSGMGLAAASIPLSIVSLTQRETCLAGRYSGGFTWGAALETGPSAG